MNYSYDLTKNTFGQLANKQTVDEFASGHLNSETMIGIFDPIYGKLIETIGRTMYRTIRLQQRWANLGTTAAENAYPQQLREIMMMQRKGKNFAMDANVRPTTLLNYDIVPDEIEVRYHSAQFRWMYDYTLADEELRRFSNGGPSTISQLIEMKTIGSMNARNMFIDSIKKKTLGELIKIATPSQIIDTTQAIPQGITDGTMITQSDARTWLNLVDQILHEMSWGSAKYNAMNQYMQTPSSSLQVIMPRAWYYNILRAVFPDTYHTKLFENILPANLLLVDSIGGGKVTDDSGTEIPATYDAKGMSLLNWENGVNNATTDFPNVQMVIIDKACLGFEDNLNTTRIGTTDAAKLMTPVFMHYWTKAYITDLMPFVVFSKGSPTA